MSRRLVVLLALVATVSMALTRHSIMAQTRRSPSGYTLTNPVVVELFTSEGCSSCPAADNLLARFDRDNAVIALGEHVDYWDGTSWQDRFASPLFTARQQDYGIAMNSGTVYTPQMIVNGEKEVLGSDNRAVAAAISAASKRPMALTTLRSANGNVLMTVGKLPDGSHKADVLLAIAENELTTNVAGGENIGRQLRHVAVVRTISKITELDPAHPGEYSAEARLNLRPDWNRANLKVILLVQDKQNRRILGAAAIKP